MLTNLSDDALHTLRDRCTERIATLEALPERVSAPERVAKIIAMREQISAELDRRHRKV